MVHAFGRVFSNSSVSPSFQRFLLRFSVLCFIFKFMINFKLIFIEGARFTLIIYYYFVYGFSNCSVPFVEKVLLPPMNCFFTLSKITWLYFCGLFLGYLFGSVDLCVYSSVSSIWPWFLYLSRKTVFGIMILPTFLSLFSKDCLFSYSRAHAFTFQN